MLVLSRQKNEAIMIGDDIEITVVDIRGDRVRLGITAPQSVSVHRKEVYEAIRRENIEASRSKVSDLAALDNLIGGTARPGEQDKKDKDKNKDKDKDKEAPDAGR